MSAIDNIREEIAKQFEQKLIPWILRTLRNVPHNQRIEDLI